MKRPETAAAATSGEMPDKKFAEKYPTLTEYLVDDKYEDGSNRELAALSLKVQDGAILAVLQDHDLSRSLFVVGGSIEEAMKSLDKRAATPGADWRAWGGGKRKRK